MSRIGWTCPCLLLAAALSLGGCGSSAAKGSPQAAAGKGAANGDLNPGGSMRRDLQQLQERERQQVKNVADMKNALSQGQGMIAAEENKLADIRSQIARYENALRMYETASYEPSRNEDAARWPTRPAEYVQPRNDPVQAMARPMPMERGGGESTLYDSRVAGIPPAAQVRQQDNAAVTEKPFAGAPVTRSQFPEPSRRRSDVEENIWNPPTKLFSERATPPRVPAAQAPAAVNQTPPPAAGSLRPAPASAPAPAASAPAQTFGAANPEDETFTPDLRF